MVEAGEHRAEERERWWVRISDMANGYNANEFGRRDEAT
jgi:hypothetical protein